MNLSAFLARLRFGKGHDVEPHSQAPGQNHNLPAELRSRDQVFHNETKTMPAEAPWEVAPIEVKQRLNAGEQLRLIDVREPFEHTQARIEGSRLIPMRTVPAALADLEGSDSSIIVFCHHGMRSMQVVSWLREQGLHNCSSLAGGIDRWSLEVDPTVPRY